MTTIKSTTRISNPGGMGKGTEMLEKEMLILSFAYCIGMTKWDIIEEIAKEGYTDKANVPKDEDQCDILFELIDKVQNPYSIEESEKLPTRERETLTPRVQVCFETINRLRIKVRKPYHLSEEQQKEFTKAYSKLYSAFNGGIIVSAGEDGSDVWGPPEDGKLNGIEEVKLGENAYALFGGNFNRYDGEKEARKAGPYATANYLSGLRSFGKYLLDYCDYVEDRLDLGDGKTIGGATTKDLIYCLKQAIEELNAPGKDSLLSLIDQAKSEDDVRTLFSTMKNLKPLLERAEELMKAEPEPTPAESEADEKSGDSRAEVDPELEAKIKEASIRVIQLLKEVMYDPNLSSDDEKKVTEKLPTHLVDKGVIKTVAEYNDGVEVPLGIAAMFFRRNGLPVPKGIMDTIADISKEYAAGKEDSK